MFQKENTEQQQQDKLPKLVAVYGTLRSGNGNHCVLRDSSLIGEHVTDAEWEMFSLGGFPGIRPGDKSITIEVYEVTSENVAEGLDCLEGYRGPDHPHNFYDKGTVTTPWGEAEIYILDGEEYEGRPLIESGDWNEHRASR